MLFQLKKSKITPCHQVHYIHTTCSDTVWVDRLKEQGLNAISYFFWHAIICLKNDSGWDWERETDCHCVTDRQSLRDRGKNGVRDKTRTRQRQRQIGSQWQTLGMAETETLSSPSLCMHPGPLPRPSRYRQRMGLIGGTERLREGPDWCDHVHDSDSGRLTISDC
jgi:hypothetical protein